MSGAAVVLVLFSGASQTFSTCTHFLPSSICDWAFVILSSISLRAAALGYLLVLQCRTHAYVPDVRLRCTGERWQGAGYRPLLHSPTQASKTSDISSSSEMTA